MMAEMPAEELAELTRAIACYQLEKPYEIKNKVVASIFEMIKNQFDKDNEKYEEICKQRAENGRKGGEAAAENKQTTAKDSKSKQKVAKGSKSKQTIAEVTEYEYESDNDLYKKKNIKKEKFEPPTVEQVREYCQKRKNNVDPEKFVDFYKSKGWKVGNQPMKDWMAAVRTWEKSETARSGTIAKVNKFNQFEQRDYDYDELEKQLLAR